MLFSENKDKKQTPKKRSIFGLLFNPDLGNDIRPLGESIGMFVRFIAMMFVAYKLFPKDHPAFQEGSNAKLTMGEVLRTGWSRLTFTRADLPRTIMYFAVVGMLAFTALLFIGIFLSLFTGKAHAQMFVPPASATNDWGISWLDYIFLGKVFTMPGTTTTNVPGCTWQVGLGTALAYYSRGMLVFAGVILLYHLMSMVAETAHSGVPFGRRANQIWAPIRLVVAIGLLVPIGAGGGAASGGGSCSVSGYNTGQYIVIQLAKWGSGLASNVWDMFVTSFNESGSDSCQPGSPSCIDAQSGEILAKSMISNYTCAKFYNYYITQAGLSGTTWEFASPVGTVVTGPTGKMLQIGNTASPQYCGGVFYKTTTDKYYTSVYSAYQTVFDSMKELEFLSISTAKYGCFVDPVTPSGRTDCPTLTNDDVESAVKKFQKKLDAAVSSALASADKAVAANSLMTSDSVFSQGGWMAAGSWFNTIARVQGLRSDSLRSGLPIPITPEILQREDNQSTTGSLSSVDQATVTSLKKFNEWLGISGKSASAGSFMVNQSSSVSAAGGLTSDDKSTLSDRLSFITKHLQNPIEACLALVDLALRTFKVITTGTSNNGDTEDYLAIKFDSNRNPLAEVANFGQNLVKASTWIFTTSAAIMAVTAIVTTAKEGVMGKVAEVLSFGLAPATVATIGKIAEFIAGMLLILGATLFAAGLSIGYMLPLFPFVRFFFGTMTWIIGVFEALVAMPLLAIAHLNPEGDGLPGGSARAGYYMILSVFLRPVLMIFGLVAGFLLFTVALSFLNTMFIIASASTGAYNTTLPTLAKVVFTVIYCGLLYILANTCFRSIGMFPQHAMDWLGGHQGHHEGMGDVAKMGAILSGVGGFVAKDALGSLTKVPGEMIGAATAKQKLLRDEAAALRDEAAAEKNQSDLLGAIGSLKGGPGNPSFGGAQHMPDTTATNDVKAAGEQHGSGNLLSGEQHVKNMLGEDESENHGNDANNPTK